MFFHHDNALAHNSAIVNAKLVELGYELLSYPPHASDFAPYETEIWVEWDGYRRNGGLFGKSSQNVFFKLVKELANCRVKCIELNWTSPFFQNIHFSFVGLIVAEKIHANEEYSNAQLIEAKA